MGTHAHQLLCFVTGLDFASLVADVGPSVAGRDFADTAMVVGRLTNGARASLQATKAASGAPHIFDIDVYGPAGGLLWRQQDPQVLTLVRQGAPTTVYHRGVAGLEPHARDSMRSPHPHPEGFREAFANIYRDFGNAVVDRLTAHTPAGSTRSWPDAAYALRSLEFVEACARSSQTQAWVDLPSGKQRGG